MEFIKEITVDLAGEMLFEYITAVQAVYILTHTKSGFTEKQQKSKAGAALNVAKKGFLFGTASIELWIATTT